MTTRTIQSLGLSAALAGALFALTPGTALARDQEGLGIGANVSLGGISGLTLNIWVAPSIMLEAMVVTNISMDRGDGHDAAFTLGGSFGVFGTLAGGDQTNLALGGRVAVFGLVNTTHMGGLQDDAVFIEGDVVLRVEHWFDDHFAINAQVGALVAVTPDPGPMAVGVPAAAISFGVGNTAGLFGGAGFTYYFDGPAAGGGGDGGGGGAAPTSAPPPSSGDTGAGQPSWE